VQAASTAAERQERVVTDVDIAAIEEVLLSRGAVLHAPEPVAHNNSTRRPADMRKDGVHEAQRGEVVCTAPSRELKPGAVHGSGGAELCSGGSGSGHVRSLAGGVTAAGGAYPTARLLLCGSDKEGDLNCVVDALVQLLHPAAKVRLALTCDLRHIDG
jgi:hypothetical protein